LLTADARALLGNLTAELATLSTWNATSLQDHVKGFALAQDVKLGSIAQPLRAALTGGQASPGIFEVMAALGHAETRARLNDICGTAH
jgi:glutamyl-tRNA synthetase